MKLKYTSAHSPRFSAADASAVDLVVKFEAFAEELPFTATADDDAEHGQDLYARAIAGDFGAVAAYAAPPPVIPAVVTMRQAMLELLHTGRLDAVEAAIAGMPREAQIAWAKAGFVERSDPLTAALVQILSLTEPQTDALFVGAAAR